jgi:peptide chain release factor subunit 1
MKALSKYEFKRKLEDLKGYRGRGTELISLYIPPDRMIADVSNYLKSEYSQASNIKSKSTRTNVQSAIESVLQRLKHYRKPPEKGMVIFSGSVDLGGDKTKLITEVIEPPEPVPMYKYHCDNTFFLEPLEEMLMEKDTYGLIVIDRREATIGFLRGKRIEPLKHLSSMVPGKHRKGGQSSVRFQRLRLIAINEFYTKVGESATEALLPMGKDLVGILIGGPSPTKEEFYEGEYLHHELQKKVIGLFDVSYTDESGLSELVENASEALQDLDIIKEKRLMNRFMKELVKDGLAAYGEEEVRRALKLGAVDTLLLSDDLRLKRVHFKCSMCGDEVIKTVKENQDIHPPKCEKDNIPMEKVKEEDPVKELTELAEQTGSDVEFISTDSEEGGQLYNAFGGIAAILRYKVE